MSLDPSAGFRCLAGSCRLQETRTRLSTPRVSRAPVTLRDVLQTDEASMAEMKFLTSEYSRCKVLRPFKKKWSTKKWAYILQAPSVAGEAVYMVISKKKLKDANTSLTLPRLFFLKRLACAHLLLRPLKIALIKIFAILSAPKIPTGLELSSSCCYCSCACPCLHLSLLSFYRHSCSRNSILNNTSCSSCTYALFYAPLIKGSFQAVWRQRTKTLSENFFSSANVNFVVKQRKQQTQ